jgi:hypothetical protein
VSAEKSGHAIYLDQVGSRCALEAVEAVSDVNRSPLPKHVLDEVYYKNTHFSRLNNLRTNRDTNIRF